jgi:hypothetical protein
MTLGPTGARRRCPLDRPWLLLGLLIAAAMGRHRIIDGQAPARSAQHLPGYRDRASAEPAAGSVHGAFVFAYQDPIAQGRAERPSFCRQRQRARQITATACGLTWAPATLKKARAKAAVSSRWRPGGRAQRQGRERIRGEFGEPDLVASQRAARRYFPASARWAGLANDLRSVTLVRPTCQSSSFGCRYCWWAGPIQVGPVVRYSAGQIPGCGARAGLRRHVLAGREPRVHKELRALLGALGVDNT